MSPSLSAPPDSRQEAWAQSGHPHLQMFTTYPQTQLFPFIFLYCSLLLFHHRPSRAVQNTAAVNITHRKLSHIHRYQSWPDILGTAVPCRRRHPQVSKNPLQLVDMLTRPASCSASVNLACLFASFHDLNLGIVFVLFFIMKALSGKIHLYYEHVVA